MIAGLAYPSALLLLALAVGVVALCYLRRAYGGWGMGRRPMLAFSRATYLTARGVAGPARLSFASLCPPPEHGAARRVDKRSAGPRGAAPAKAWPFLVLINRPAAGAARSIPFTVD